MPLMPRSASPRTMLWSIDSKRMLTNSVVRPSARAKSSAISTSKPTRRSGRDGSASTNGAPPSGSPAQRRTLGGAAAKTAEDTKAAKNAKDRANTGVDFMRRRCDGDCRLSRYGAARERNGGADAAERRRGDGVESYGGQGARARAARRESGRVAGRGRRRRRARAHDAARRRRRRSSRRRPSSPPRKRRHRRRSLDHVAARRGGAHSAAERGGRAGPPSAA